jgi:cytochrome c oxidase subunit 2
MSAPLNYLTSHGARADMILPLTRGVLIISIIVILIVCGLLAAAIFRRRPVEAPGADPRGLLFRPRGGLTFVYVGVGISTLVLVATTIRTMKTLADVVSPPREAKLTIEVTGHQWWWEARYFSEKPAEIFTTANEIHIPAGEPVRFKLIGGDVIHSFWVPALAGKTDTIPGQTNITWLQAERPGVYRGQCTEYCGKQHANMAFFVVADEPARFEEWRQKQIAPTATSADVAQGLSAFQTRCGACHTVRGTLAGGTAAPDLTHLMTRASIGANTLPTNAGTLSAWIVNPQSPKPGNHMPVLQLTPDEVASLDAFLVTLN